MSIAKNYARGSEKNQRYCSISRLVFVLLSEDKRKCARSSTRIYLSRPRLRAYILHTSQLRPLPAPVFIIPGELYVSTAQAPLSTKRK